MKRLNGIYFACMAGMLMSMTLFSGQARGGENAGEVLFANDLGPAEVDVSSYPANLQKTYRTSLRRCAKCHKLSRPFNSPFLELDQEVIDALKKERPEVFEDKNVVNINKDIWKRYVKRMMRKPGSGISRKEGKKIWEFLRHDSQVRKSGKNLDKWIKHRKKLLEEFKKKDPKRYEEHYGAEG